MQRMFFSETRVQKLSMMLNALLFLPKLISDNGGEPILSRTGHSFIKKKLKETNAALAGEMSGHIFFKERWYGFDDALYTGARLLEIVSKSNKTCSEIFDEFPVNSKHARN